MGGLLQLDEARLEQGQRGFMILFNGAQHGDEGKGKGIDLILTELETILRDHPDVPVMVVRFNGSHNAGHTIRQGDREVVLHIIPCGVFHENVQAFIGAGVLVNPVKLLAEMAELHSIDLAMDKRLKIDPRATLVLPHEPWLDRLTGKKTGTTGQGVGPAVADKAMRQIDGELTSLTFAEALEDLGRARDVMLTNFYACKKRYQDILDKYPDDPKLHLSNMEIVEQVQATIQALREIQEKELISDNPFLVQDTIERGGIVIGETAQGTMLDPLYGDRPYNTSTPTLPQYVAVGGGANISDIRTIVSAIKIPPSRVGDGAFISEVGGPEAEKYRSVVSAKGIDRVAFAPFFQKLQPYLSEQGKSMDFLESFYRGQEAGGNSVQAFEGELDVQKLFDSGQPFLVEIAMRIVLGEYGASTGRPRGVGMIDLCQLAFSLRLSNTTHLLLNRIDKLPEMLRDIRFPGIPVVVGYEDLDTGVKSTVYPNTDQKRRNVQPVIEWIPLTQEQVAKPLQPGMDKGALPEGVTTFIHEFRARLGAIMGQDIPLACIGIGPEAKDLVVLDGIVIA